MMFKIICNRILFVWIVILAAQQAHGEACPYILGDNYDALDAALPCVNFRNVPQQYRNTLATGQRHMRGALQHGIYTELVGSNLQESICRRDAYADKLNNAAEMERIFDDIAARFVHYRSNLRQLREASARDATLTRMSYGPRGEPGETAARGASEGMLGLRDAARDRQRDQLISRIPYGFEPHIANAIRELDLDLPEDFPEGGADVAEFRRKIYAAFRSTWEAYDASEKHFRSLERATHCVIERPPQPAETIYRPEETAPRECPAGEEPRGTGFFQEEGTWRAFSQSGAIEALSTRINHPVPRTQQALRSTVTCEGDPYAQERANLSSANIIIGGVMFIPGVGPLIGIGMAAALYGDRIYRSCYQQATGFRVTAEQSCSAGVGLEAAVHAADTTDCGSDIFEGAMFLPFSGVTRSIGGIARTFGARGRSATGYLSSFADDGARIAGSGADDAGRLGSGGADEIAEVVDDTPIVVTGTRTRTRTRTRVADDVRRPAPAGRGGTRGAAETTEEAGDTARAGAQSRSERVSVSDADRTRLSEFVDNNIGVDDVRLSTADDRALAQITYDRKREIDELIGGRAGRDIHAEHAELNRYLDRGDLDGYIRNRSFGTERARQLREAVTALQRERTVLTRARVNADLATLRPPRATTRSVECAAVNALNSNPAFHRGSRCSVVTFRETVENYCACGQAGGLGAWAGPCAEHFLDYLTPEELADRDALPERSARGLQDCKRIRIPAGTTVVHGGLNPTMSGHGGAAQIFIPSRALAPRVRNGRVDSSRLDGATDALNTLGIPREAVVLADDAPRIQVIAVAPLHPDPTVTRIFSDARACGGPGNCSQQDVNTFVVRFNLYRNQNPNQVTDLQRSQFDEWTQWLRGCRDIDVSGTSSYGPIISTRPGCGNL